MSKQNKRASTFIPIEYPPKKRRGRPHKEGNLGQMENAQSPQPFELDSSNDMDDQMVGQEVTGVIEGCFEAGYFISVRATKAGILLRGVVFQRGLFTPVTAANDVAPHVKMYKRREFPVPDLNQTISDTVSVADTLPRTVTGTLVVGRSSNPRRNSKFGLEKDYTPEFKSCSVFPLPKLSHTFAKPPSSTEPMQNKQMCASLETQNTQQQQQSEFAHQLRRCTIPPNSNLPNNSSGDSVGGRNMTFPLPRVSMWGKEIPQKNFNPALDNKPMPQSKSDTTFPLPTDMLRGNNLSRQNSNSGVQKQAAPKSQLGAPFPLARRLATVTLPLTDSLSNKNASVSLGGKEIPQQTLKLSLDNRHLPQLKSGKPFASDEVPPTDSLPKINLASSLIEKYNPQQISQSNELDNRSIPHLKSDIAFSFGKQSASTILLPTEKSEEGKKQNYGFGLGDISTPRLKKNRISKQDDIEGKKDAIRHIASELTLGIFPEKLTFSITDTQHHELPWYEFHGNRKPVAEAADNTAGVPLSVPKEPVKMKEGITTSDSEPTKTRGSFQLFP